jgi:hypothetical protein
LFAAAAELLKGFRVQFGGIGIFLLHPGGLSEDFIAIGLPVLLFVGGGFVALPIVPGGTLIMLPKGSVPVLLFTGSADVTFLTGLNILVFPGVPVLLPVGSAFPRLLGRPVCPLVIGPVLLPEGGSAFVRAVPPVVT